MPRSKGGELNPARVILEKNHSRRVYELTTGRYDSKLIHKVEPHLGPKYC
jgi:hypothetical protein